MLRRKFTVVVLFFIFIIPTSIRAANTDTIVCDYLTYSDPKGIHKVESEFKLTFIIDREKETAYLVGNNGSSEVKLLPAIDGISFIEVTRAGNIATTTLDSKASSVHSRNMVIAGEIVPSQYYGKCIFK